MAAVASGKDKVARWVRVLVDGVNLSGDVRSFSSLDDKLMEAPTWGLDSGSYAFLSSGERQIGLRGYQALMNDTAVTGSYVVLAASGTKPVVTVFFGGGGEPAVPDPAYAMPGVHLSTGVTMTEKLATLTGDFLPTSTATPHAPWGVTLGYGALTSTTTGSSHDNAAASTNGWSATLHVTVSSGGPWAFKIQHSTDDSSYADLATFTSDGSELAGEHIQGSATVNRYVRLVATRTSGTCSIACAFTRD